MAKTTLEKAPKKAAPKKTAAPVEAEPQVEAPVAAPVQPARVESFTPTEIDPNQIVVVRNGFPGVLVYKSRKTGEKFIWDEFGAEQDMELSELKSARSAHKSYFINNWFMFDEPWVVDYLGLAQYYKHAIPIDSFDEFFEKSADEIKEAAANLSKEQKRSLSYRARQLIAEGGIDSNKTIRALEESLGVELVEK